MEHSIALKYIKYFTLGFIIFSILFMMQFIGIYFLDIFGKGISIRNSSPLLFYTFITILGSSSMFGVLFASIFSFKYFASNPEFSFKKILLIGLLFILGFSSLSLAYNNWILPKAKIEMRSLLYCIQQTAPDSELYSTDTELFRSQPYSLTLSEINSNLDSLQNETLLIKNKCDSVLSLLPGSIASLHYENYSLNDRGILFNYSDTSYLSEKQIRKIGYKIDGYDNRFESILKNKNKLQHEIIKRFSSPFVFLLLYLIGASLGYYYSDQKSFLLVVLSFFTINYFSRIVSSIEKSISEGFINNAITIIFLLLVLFIVTATFIILGLKKENKLLKHHNAPPK